MYTIPPEELVEIEVRGQKFTLHFGMWAWMEFQRVSGFSILGDVLLDADLADTERCMRLLWAGLREFHPEIETVEEVARMVTLRDMEQIREKLKDAIRATSPAPNLDKARPPKAQSSSASRGGGSGRSASKTSD